MLIVMDGAGTKSGHELVIGLVGAIGVDLDRVVTKLARALERVDYGTKAISLIRLVSELHPNGQSQPKEHEQLCHQKMDMGNDLRKWTKRKDVLSAMGMMQIRNLRAAHWQGISHGAEELSNKPIERCAYVLRSLKTPEEVRTLQDVYGNNCFVIAAYSSAQSRKTRLSDKIAASHSDTNKTGFESLAAQLIERDERESGEDFGQNVQGTFCMADVFVDADHEEDAEKQIERFIQLLFSHPFRTPTRAEFGMFQAFGAARCSASAGRQVGAAVATDWGDLVAVGVNEVAKALGGQYHEGDREKDDGRDHLRRTDSNAEMNRHVLEDLLARMKSKGWLSEKRTEHDVATLVKNIKSEGLLEPFARDDPEAAKMPSLLRTARILHGIEFIRAVHAEMAALMSLVRCGISAKSCTMYVTTFPCHECAKHIVASGIKQVVFIEPYPKSRVADLFSDSIVVDEAESKHNKVSFIPYVGIAPRRYLDLFEAPRRKTENDSWVDWDRIRRFQKPRLGGLIETYVDKEQEFVAGLRDELKLLYDEQKIKMCI